MLDRLVKKHAAPLAVLCVAALAYAAYYFVPANPDTPALRSGTLFVLLALMLYVPVSRALSRQPLRALVYGGAFAYVLLLCIGVGCELEFYDGLLPGMGALLRRFAAPALLAPAVGSLVSFAFTFAPAHARQKKPIPFAVFFLVLVACYGACLLALYPGVISYDFEHEIQQITSGVYLAAHPVFHTLLMGRLIRLGEAIFGSMTAGCALYHAVQLTLLAALYAWALTFVQRRIPRAAVLLLFAGFALLPFHGVLAVSTAKDPLFAWLCTALCLLLWEIAENPAAFLSSRPRIARFALCCLGVALLRHNGVFAYTLALIAALVLLRKHLRRAALIVLTALVLCVGVPKGLEAALHAEETPSTELMSIPCQQLMRTAARAELTPGEYDKIAAWFSFQVDRYRENCADPAKGGNFDSARLKREAKDFLSLYLKTALRHPRIYAEAFLENTIGLWYPGDTSHAHTLSGEQAEYIYLNTVYPFPPERYPIEPRCLFPALEKLLYQTMHFSKHENVPFLAQLYCPATYTFALLLATLLAFYKRRRAQALALLPMWGLTLSIFFAAGVFVRYAYPMMAAVPLLLLLVLFSSPSGEVFSCPD